MKRDQYDILSPSLSPAEYFTIQLSHHYDVAGLSLEELQKMNEDPHLKNLSDTSDSDDYEKEQKIESLRRASNKKKRPKMRPENRQMMQKQKNDYASVSSSRASSSSIYTTTPTSSGASTFSAAAAYVAAKLSSARHAASSSRHAASNLEDIDYQPMTPNRNYPKRDDPEKYSKRHHKQYLDFQSNH